MKRWGTPRILAASSIVFYCLVLCCGTGWAADASLLNSAIQSIRVDDLRRHTSVLASDAFEGREAGTPGGQAASDYLVNQLRKWGISGAGPDGNYRQEFQNGYHNVLVRFDGSDPDMKQDFILVGAHFDHVGYGTVNNSRGPIGQIHNGADDNASGVSSLLEVIEALHILGFHSRRSLLFAFWDAEEKGLLGSEYWVAHPTVPFDRLRMTITVDMIGRLRPQGLSVFGIRTASGLRQLVSEQNRGIGLRLAFTWRMQRDSDHYPFFQHAIPSLMLHTGKHEDYHRPSDDVDRINFTGLEQVSRLLFRLVVAVADRVQLPQFRPESAEEDIAQQEQIETPLPTPSPRFGVNWNEALSEKGIVELTWVTSGSAADRAGLRVGDRIVQFGAFPVNRFQDFRTLVLTTHNPVTILAKRKHEDSPIPLTAKLDGEPLRVGVSWRTDDAEPHCVILTQVVPGSPADRAGLHPNDRILRLNQQTFASSDQFHEMISKFPSPLDVTLERDGRFREMRIQLGPDRSIAGIETTE